MAFRAVFFDVDFTLIAPGPAFQGSGYKTYCASRGIEVDEERFADAVLQAAPLLDGPEDAPYDAEMFVAYTRRIIEGMGGRGAAVAECARELYDEWASNRHFELYPDVPEALARLNRDGLRIGLISNSHRCLASFQSHFELQHLVDGALSSSDHGFMKPRPSIFEAALRLLDVRADDAIMVGDSVRHDVEGALRVGMAAVFIHRGHQPHPRESELARRGVPTIRSLVDLSAIVSALPPGGFRARDGVHE